MTDTITIKKTEIRSGGIIRDAWVLQREGRTISQPFPTRATAKAEAEAMAEEFSDVSF